MPHHLDTRCILGADRTRRALAVFRALPRDMAPRDAQDLMAYPFFSLAKSRRTAPIDFRSGTVTIRVEGTQEHGITTIWDADILIWAASQIVEARSARRGNPPVAPDARHALRDFALHRARGISRDYQRLKAALDRLQSSPRPSLAGRHRAGRRAGRVAPARRRCASQAWSCRRRLSG